MAQLFSQIKSRRFCSASRFSEATYEFARGDFCLYEIKLYKFDADDSGTVPTDGTTEPSGKTDGQFHIYYFLVDQNWPRVHQEIQKAFVEAHNHHMHQLCEHPEKFDKDGLPLLR